MFNILVVEDDKNLRKLITTCLKKNNYTTFEANDGEEALDMLDKNYINLIISDVMMPKMDGFELIKELRMSEYKLPILLITAKDSINDKKEGFLLGADDYMVKPINIEELLLRVKVLLRRTENANERKIKIGDFILNYDQMSATKNDKVYFLAQKEFIDNVSHEIKTPISSIQGLAELLKDKNLTQEEREEYTDIIIDESNRLLNLATNMLKLSKLQNQNKIEKREQIDVAEQIRKAILLLEPKWSKKEFGHTLKPKYNECQEGFTEMASNHINSGIIVVPDEIVDEQYIAFNSIIGNYYTDSLDEQKEIQEQIINLVRNPLASEYSLPSVNSRVDISEASIGLGALVTFLGLYLGIVFLIASVAILALKELTESTDNKERYNVLRKLGADEKMINKSLFRQIAIFFMFPLIVAIIHSIFGITFCSYIIETFGNEQLLPSIIMTAIFIVVIYGGYFLITYLSSKNIIKDNRNAREY